MKSIRKTLKIGTRGSPLARVQARMVCEALEAAWSDLEVETVIFQTSGDWKPEHGEVHLDASQGGKAQFAKEIQIALLNGEVDAAVHSMKDMDSVLPEGLGIDHMLPRADVRDALLISNKNKLLAKNSQFIFDDYSVFPKGCVAGMASVRRAAFLKHYRPDIEVVPLRGNVQTRIQKLRGEYEGFEDQNIACTFLAMAGLKRLELADEADLILEPEVMLPAAGQGAVGIETRIDDHDVKTIFSRINHLKTLFCVNIEREMLAVLDGSCHTPIGAYAVVIDDEVFVRVCVLSLDGSQKFEDAQRWKIESDLEQLDFAPYLQKARDMASALRADIPKGVLSEGRMGDIEDIG